MAVPEMSPAHCLEAERAWAHHDGEMGILEEENRAIFSRNPADLTRDFRGSFQPLDSNRQLVQTADRDFRYNP